MSQVIPNACYVASTMTLRVLNSKLARIKSHAQQIGLLATCSTDESKINVKKRPTISLPNGHLGRLEVCYWADSFLSTHCLSPKAPSRAG